MNILLIGQGPLPVENGEKNTAPAFRAWYFGRALAENGHSVVLVSVHPGEVNGSKRDLQQPNLLLYPASQQDIIEKSLLESLAQEYHIAAVVGAGIWPSYLAALYLPEDLPLWADLFGSPLSEAQAKAFVYQDDAVIEPFSRFERTVLARADFFSAVSTPQQYALVGALAHMGRLNAATYGYPLVCSIPAATEPQTLPHDHQVFRRNIVPEEDFALLWSGGYNTWTDIETLFAGLEKAMQRAPRLHFVSTGGALPPHDSTTYPRFCELVESSPNRERYHLLGWQPFETVHNFYIEADAGIILDKWSYEAELGSRTRLLDWCKYGLPAVTTLGAELTHRLSETGAVFSFPHGDPEALADLLVRLSEEPELLKKAGKKAQVYVQEHYIYNKVCVPLLEWASNPRRAPDAGKPRLELSGKPDVALEKQVAYLTSQVEQKNSHILALEKWAAELEAQLKEKNNSPVARLVRRVKEMNK